MSNSSLLNILFMLWVYGCDGCGSQLTQSLYCVVCVVSGAGLPVYWQGPRTVTGQAVCLTDSKWIY